MEVQDDRHRPLNGSAAIADGVAGPQAKGPPAPVDAIVADYLADPVPSACLDQVPLVDQAFEAPPS